MVDQPQVPRWLPVILLVTWRRSSSTWRLSLRSSSSVAIEPPLSKSCSFCSPHTSKNCYCDILVHLMVKREIGMIFFVKILLINVWLKFFFFFLFLIFQIFNLQTRYPVRFRGRSSLFHQMSDNVPTAAAWNASHVHIVECSPLVFDPFRFVYFIQSVKYLKLAL